QFAPMLVYFRNVPPLHAMKLSLRAFLYNMLPMLLYGITFAFLSMLASIPVMLGWLVLLPLVFTTLYACYNDIFPPLQDTVSPAPQDDIFKSDESTFK
ncbi:MAG TPA: hypothetical protein VMV70_10275, partial [Gallionella sp.]|nr:hypothetical protein [Gallionella sp.]